MTITGIQGHWFLDDRGRRVLLRGVNLGGGSKLPSTPPGSTHLPFRDGPVSFVGRPFPLAEAGEHYARLRGWGFNCLRFLTTWEAIEHAGPGEYDVDYLDYLAEVVARAADFGFHVFIDPHQDVWSRFSGGDGAPRWTLELAGFDVDRLDASEAALTMQRRYPDYGTMVWSGNRRRLAAATMFTLFFAGERFAPGCSVGGEAIGAFLQRHFIAAMEQVATRLKGMSHVLGYDSLNEPSAGYIGLPSLSATWPPSNHGPVMTGFQTMTIPAGFSATVPAQQRVGPELRPSGDVTLNPHGIPAWLPERDIWRAHGVWDVDRSGRPVLLRDDYFAGVSFHADGLAPFARRYAAALRRAHPGAILFIEGEPHNGEPLTWDGEGPVVNAGHWYDSLTNRTKHYDPELAINTVTGEVARGRAAVEEAFAGQVGILLTQSQRDLAGAPTLVGEFGAPMDLDGGEAIRSGDWSQQEAALSAYFAALDRHLAHGTLWNYTPDNDNTWGDHWNGEDFSIFSRDQQPVDDGARALRGFCRPAVRACAGLPLAQRFLPNEGVYRLEIDADPALGETVIYAPRVHFPDGPAVHATGGNVRCDLDNQLVIWTCDRSGRQALSLTRAAVGR
jgi:hypothetical protein